MKKAFSLIEIGIILFIVIAISFTIIPFSISNIQDARFISDWKNYSNQMEYSTETLIEYKKTQQLDNEQTITKLMDYLDGKEISKDDKVVKNYKYKMLNGKFYEKMNLNKFNKIYYDEQKRIIGIEQGSKQCSQNIPCATIWIDLNGNKGPNTVGKDIFIYELYSNGAKPYGHGENINTLRVDCSLSGTGMSCSKYYLLGGELK